MGKVLDVPLPQRIYGSAIKPDRLGADLLIVANHDDLTRDVLQEQGLWARLAGFIDDRHIKKIGRWLGCLGYPIDWHHPRRDGPATVVEMVARLFPVLRGILPGALSDFPNGEPPRHEVFSLLWL